MGLLALLLIWTALPSAAATSGVDGFIQAQPPIELDGALSTRATDPIVHVTNPDLGIPDAPLLITAREATITRVTYEAEGSSIADRSIAHPGSNTNREVSVFENATFEVSALGPGADLLLFPSEQGVLFSEVPRQEMEARIEMAPDGLRVVDGYRKTFGDREQGSPSDFEWSMEQEGPLPLLTAARSLTLNGTLSAYIWDAHVQVRNGTDVLQDYETGRSRTEGAMGATWSEHWEYLVIEMEGAQATVHPGSLRADVYAPAFPLELTGTARLPAPGGTFVADEKTYRTDGPSMLTLQGDLRLDVTPRTAGGSDSGDAGTLTIGLGGTLDTVSIQPLDQRTGFSSPVVAATAGGATVLGLAVAWYVFGVKGASLALLARPKRQEETQGPDMPEGVTLERPGDLLLDTDRFTLYHLLRSKAGLSAAECQALTGIEDAGKQLDLLADHGLLAPLSEDPRRYCIPGTITEPQARHITFLRDPDAFRLASLLAIHGLMPQELLLERARKAESPVPRWRAVRLIDGFVDRGLAIREPGEYGKVVDPSQTLFECLQLMGERSLATTA